MEKSFEFAENVVGFMINDEIDQKKMEEILSKIKDRLGVVSPICLYVEDESNEGISVRGFLKALEFHFSHSNDLDKVAIVSDNNLFQKVMEVKDLLVPAKVQVFERKDRVKAMNWVMQ